MSARCGNLFVQLMIVVVFLTLTSPAIAANVCEGYTKEGRVTRLDGANAVIKGILTSLEDVRSFVDEYESEILAVLAERGLSGAGEGVLAKLRAGELEAVALDRGDTMEWMLTRKKGKVTSFGPLCMAGKKKYDAWRFEVKEKGAMEDRIHTFLLPGVCGNLALVSTRSIPKPPPILPPVVLLNVERDCETGMIRVDTEGSSADAEITMTQPDGSKVVVSAGEIPDPAPFTSELVFEAVSRNTSRAGEEQVTTKSKSLGVCPALPPSCQLLLSQDEVWVRGDFVVETSGHWKADGFALRILDAKEREVERHVPAPDMPYRTSIHKPGRYFVQGGATNEVGETWGCQAEIYVRPRWNVKPKAVVVSPTNRTTTYTAAPNDIYELYFNTSVGAELDLEYHASRLIGIELGGVGSSMDTTLTRTLGGASASDSDSLGITMIHAALNFHLSRLNTIDFYIGPVIAWGNVGSGSYRLMSDTVDLEGGSELGYGAQMGLAVPLGKASRWALDLGIRFLRFSTEDDLAAGETKSNPFVAGLGLSYGF